MTIHAPPPEGGRIIDEPMETALSRRYLAYALSTITNRALPDVRDGFKPVHRRIMYAMHQMRLNPQAAARKCAKVVGEVMGGYHPHGDASIYDALVRLAQDFSQRYPLVDGQGNFGNIDGDSAAAMRYTECKLTPAAVLLLTPVFLPMAASIGMDPVQLGIMMVVNLAVGLYTPPVGTTLFITSALAKVKVGQTVRELGPFYFVAFLVLALVSYVPASILR